MPSLSRFAATALTGGFFVFGTAAFAETQIAPEDFPWGLEEGRSEDVRITLEDIGVISMDWLEVKRYGDDAITVTLSPQVSMTGAIGSNVGFDAEIASENWVMDFTRAEEDERVNFDLTADRFDLTFGSEAVATEAEFTSTDLLVTSTITQLDAIFEAVKSGAEPDFELLNDIEMAMTIEAQTMTSRTAIPDPLNPAQQQISINEAGPNRTEFSMGDGKIALSGEAEYGFIVESDPIPFEVKHGAMSFAFATPFDASPDPQEIVLALDMADISIDEKTWALADPDGIFPRDIGKFVFDSSMQVILEIPLFDRKAMQRAAVKGKEPFVLVEATMTAMEIDALGLKASGNGTVELEGEIPTALSAYFSVKGLPEFMDRAQEAGFLKQQQAMMAEGMANHFGKKEDDGTLVFDIGVDGGMVTVNDSPVAPLPQ